MFSLPAVQLYNVHETVSFFPTDDNMDTPSLMVVILHFHLIESMFMRDVRMKTNMHTVYVYPLWLRKHACSSFWSFHSELLYFRPLVGGGGGGGGAFKFNLGA